MQAFDRFEAYPLNLPRQELGEQNLQYLQSELEKRSSSLFVTESNECSVEVSIEEKSDSRSKQNEVDESKLLIDCLSTFNELKKVLGVIHPVPKLPMYLIDMQQKEPSPGGTRLLILHRANSWSRMKITADMFKALCTVDHVMPHFLNIIFGLGRKTVPIDENYMTCYHHFSDDPESKYRDVKTKDDGNGQCGGRETGYGSYDICYNLRHFELHERDLDCPWSCRQSAIHQKHHFANKYSKWIIVQPPVSFTAGLKDTGLGRTAHPMCLHIRYLTAATLNWREFLNHMSEKLTILDHKISFPKSFKEFDLNFSFSQQLHILRQKLDHARFILENTLSTVASLKVHAKKVAQIITLSTSVHHSFQNELENISSELRNHFLTACKLLRLLEAIRLMSNSILEFRDQELLYNNEFNLAQTAQQNLLEKRIMVVLADKTARDSRTMRIATVVAILYLPANLVMSFFSSSLVELSNSTSGATGEAKAVSAGMQIHREIWVAILTIVALTFLTLLPTLYLGRKGKGRHATTTA